MIASPRVASEPSALTVAATPSASAHHAKGDGEACTLLHSPNMIDTILTFFYKLLQSLLYFFSLVRRPVWKSPTPVDIEEGVVDEKIVSTALDFDPAVIGPTADSISAKDSFVEVSLSNEEDTDESRAQSITTPPKDTSSAAQKLERAKLLDILVQFPLPPSHNTGDDDGASPVPPETNQATLTSSITSRGRLFRKLTGTSGRTRKQQVPPVPPLPLLPLSE
ncbi:hypothetical protein MD484_g6990, partial [Candolleomyces efflorescens]